MRTVALKNFFTELKRRNVYKVAVAYAVVGWVIAQIATQIFPFLEVPNWVVRLIIVLIAIGFPIALVIAWAFEITPQGIERTEVADTMPAVSGQRKHVWIYVVIVGAAISAALFFLGRYTAGSGTPRPASVELRPGEQSEASTVSAKSIAVLPFANLSRDPDNAFFAEGVQDEILTRLSKIAALKVISRTSTQHFKSAPENLPEIAKQLGVANILEGSVQKANDQVRVNVQLIKAANDSHLWADTFDRKLTDLFTVESEIAQAIADTLQAKLTGSEKGLLAKKPTANPEAYELYLKGRFFWNKRTAADLRKAIDYFNAAIAKDPDYALAYAALAQAWVLLPAHNAAAPKDCVAPAEAAISKALALDETSSEAHAARGLLRASFQFNFLGAASEFERALQLNPNDSTALHWSAMNQVGLGQSERAIAELRRALEIDPLSLVINTNLAVAMIHARRLDEAIAQLRKTIEMDAGFAYGHRALGTALELQGKIPDAIAEYQKAISLGDDVPAPALLAHLYGSTGRREEAIAILEQLMARREHGFADPYWFAIAYLGLGDREHALGSLEEAYNERSGDDLSNIRVEAMLDPLHGDPRFEALAEKIMPAREFHGSAK